MAAKSRHSNLEPDRQGHVLSLSLTGFHRVAYADWGPIDAAETVVCLHGLTRQGRDFDYLARDLADAGFRVVCPDLVGRGRSGWLPNVTDYVFPQYCSDMGALLASLHAKSVHWVGTSLGGLVGMVLASVPGTPIARLVINDIGPDVPYAASSRVGMRLATDPGSFASLEDAERYMRKTYAACGDLDDAHWRQMTVHAVKQDSDSGRFNLLIDPKIGTAYQWFWYYRMSLWTYWRKLSGPVMLVHGAKSDFVPASLVKDMRKALPSLHSYEVADAGHMPSLMAQDQIEAVRSFLTSR